MDLYSNRQQIAIVVMKQNLQMISYMHIAVASSHAQELNPLGTFLPLFTLKSVSENFRAGTSLIAISTIVEHWRIDQHELPKIGHFCDYIFTFFTHFSLW